MSLVRVVMHQYESLVYSPFEAKDLIKSMPERSWDKTAKAWIIPTVDVDDLKALLENQGYVVVTIDQRETDKQNKEQRRQEPPPPPPQGDDDSWSRRRGAADDWATQMFWAVGPELAPKVHKALARVLHPDAGGDAELMKQVNVAADRTAAHR